MFKYMRIINRVQNGISTAILPIVIKLIPSKKPLKNIPAPTAVIPTASKNRFLSSVFALLIVWKPILKNTNGKKKAVNC